MAKTPEGRAMSVREELTLYLRMVHAMGQTVNAEALEARSYSHTPIEVTPVGEESPVHVLITVDLDQTTGGYLNCITDFVFNLGTKRVVVPVDFSVQRNDPRFTYHLPRTVHMSLNLWPRHPK